MEARYQSRISQSEVRAALLSMLPNLNLTATAGNDDSDFQLYEDYVEMGAQVSWNLMTVFNGPSNRRVAKAQVDVAEQQRLALAMAVVSQVHIANMNFVQSRQEYAVSEDYLSVSRRLTKQTRNAQKVAKFGELEVIRQEASLLLATMRRDIAFANLQNSFATVYASVGLDIVPDRMDADDMTPEKLATAITRSLQTWGLKYKNVTSTDGGFVPNPIAIQNPVLRANGFTFAANTFAIGKPVTYNLGTQSGAPLPDWLKFDPTTRTLSGAPPEGRRELSLRVVAQGPEARTSDSFILRIDPSASDAVPLTSAVAAAASPTASAIAVAKPQARQETKPKAKLKVAPSGLADRFVQAKALSSKTDANAFAAEIKNRVGMQAFVRRTQKRNPPLYRVIIPAFSKEDIRSIQKNLEIIGVTDSFVVRK
jgi:hypothetical protein